MELAFQKSIDYNVLMVEEKEDEISTVESTPPCAFPSFDGAIVIIIFSSLLICHSAIFIGDSFAALIMQLKSEQTETMNVWIVISCEYIFTSALAIIICWYQLEHNISSLKDLYIQNGMTKTRHWGQVQIACALTLALSMSMAYCFNAVEFLTGQLFLLTGLVHINVSILAVVLVKFKWI